MNDGRQSAPMKTAADPADNVSPEGHQPPDVLDDPLMFLPEVEKTTRRSGTSIWRDEKRGKFPPRHKHGNRAAWFQSQIVSYLKSLRNAATGPGPAPTKANEARRQAAAHRRAEREAYPQ